MKALIGLGVAVFLIVAGTFMWFLGINNTCARYESDIDARYNKNQISLAGYTNKIMDMVQVPKMAVQHIKDVATSAIQGRYGKEGAKQLFLAIQEQNPSVDQMLYRQLMQAIEAGRNGWDADQTTMADMCGSYQKYYIVAPTSSIAGFWGYPHDDYKISNEKGKCAPVITEQTAEDFKTKRTGPLQLNP
jgi:hypothetical protein